MPRICKVEGCKTPVGEHGAKGLCPYHYYRCDKGKCSVEKCLNPAKTAGLCAMHYSRLHRHANLNHTRRKRANCKVAGCDAPAHGFGYCKKHYSFFKRYGDAEHPGKYIIPKDIPKGGTYTSYRCMLQRCYNTKSSAYKYYGGRGVKVCDRWAGEHGYENFYTDMGERPLQKLPSGGYEYSLDRIDPNGDYCPENCRWADKHTQSSNRRPYEFNKSRTKGYCYCPKGGFWMAYLCYHGEKHQIRCHSQKEAIRAREALIAKYIR